MISPGPTLRLRLTAWYVLLLGLILALFGAYLYVQLQRTLLLQLDAALEVVSSQALSNTNDEGPGAAFRDSESFREMVGQLRASGFVVRIVGLTGEVVDGFGNYQALPPWTPTVPETATLESQGVLWRIHTQSVESREGHVLGWLQAAQSLAGIETAAESLRVQILIGLPLALVLAGLVGFFLADRALRPIDRITRIAQSIRPSDLGSRIDYRGPQDEVGRLAGTLDAMLERLQAAFERERRFTADASHELRTPLTAIQGRLNVTLSRSRSGPEYESDLRGLEYEVDRLIRLTTDLLFLTRLDRDRPPWQPQTIDFSEWLKAIVDQMRPLLQERNLRLEEDIPSDLTVYGDPDHLIRLFMNLLDNAIAYSPPGGQVTVRAERGDAQVHVMVSDTGPGIPPEHLPHVADRFYRVEASRGRERGGAGLGLAIASEIARWHGGTLEVRSKGVPGKGTTFVCRLPIHP